MIPTPDLDELIELIERRNAIQIASGDSDRCWQMLGVANRHILRVIDGEFTLVPGVVREIEACFERTIKECPVKL